MAKFRLSDELALPDDAVTERIAVVGRTGMGKSYTGGVLLEEALHGKHQAVVLDLKGDFWGIRASADGKGPGSPITILGGEPGHAPREAGAGKIVADMVALERLSFILDFSLFEHRDDEVRFATEFADRLYRKNRNPMLFFVDEADSFIPQMPETREERRMMLRFDVIARRGRKRGIGLVLMTQRSAAIHKGALSPTELLIPPQTSAPQDRLAVVSWMANKGSPEDQRKLMETLPKLKKGRALAWSPGWLQVFKEIGVRPQRTVESSATPP